MNESERDALLIRLDERTLQMHHTIYGNGQPGIISDVATIKTEVAVIKAAVKGTGPRSDSVKAAGIWGSVAAVLVITTATIAKVMFGVG